MRAFLRPGEQRRFIDQAVAATGCRTLKEAAGPLRVPYFRLRDWRLERTRIRMEVIEDWCRRFHLPAPEVLEVRDENWGRVLAGKRAVELHGPPGTPEGRSLGGKRSAEARRRRGCPGGQSDSPETRQLAEQIQRLHWEEGLSQRELRRVLGLSWRRLSQLTQVLGIRFRSYREAVELAKRQGTLTGRPHTPETRLLLKRKMYERYASGWVATGGRCKKLRYVSPSAGAVTLDGTWEALVARLMDEAGIRWQRNRRGFAYIGRDGKRHLYFPDFYLPDYDLFVEVKGYLDDDARHKLACFKAQQPGKLVVLHGKKMFAALHKGLVDIGDVLGVTGRALPAEGGA